MRRMTLFLIILVSTVVALSILALVSWYLAASAPAFYGSSWMKQMWGGTGNSASNGGMGGMMGNGGTTTSSTSYLWLIPALLGTVVGVAVIGVAFYYAFPELKYIRGDTTCNLNASTIRPQTSNINSANQTTANVAPKAFDNCDVILKTMTSDEKKILNILLAHQGKYLQKYVVKESGLSRLKTHRIIARFAERGIVTVKEVGNTNEVIVSDWVKK
jgi:hypothetical protein